MRENAAERAVGSSGSVQSSRKLEPVPVWLLYRFRHANFIIPRKDFITVVL